jgi:hypothetical protein
MPPSQYNDGFPGPKALDRIMVKGHGMHQEWNARRLTRRSVCRAAGLSVATMALGGAAGSAGAQGATPAAEPAAGDLAAMFARVPAMLPELDDPGQVTIAYADIAAQLDVTGVTPPTSMDDEAFSGWMAATLGLPMPMIAAQYLKFWREDYGFDLLQTDQTLFVSLPPFDLSLYRGRFDPDAVRATLTANGYQPVDINGHELLSLRDDYEQDIAGPFAYKLAAMNHAAFLADGTIAFASAKAPLAAVLDVEAGLAPSMLESAGIGLLLAGAPANLASAMLINGVSLAGNLPPGLLDLGPGATPDISAIATQVAATSEMPPVVMALLIATTGGSPANDELPAGTPDARVGAVLLLLTPEAAERAAPVVEERLETGTSIATGEPYAGYFPEHTVTAVAGAPVVVIDLALAEDRSSNILINMLYNRDLGFIAW